MFLSRLFRTVNVSGKSENWYEVVVNFRNSKDWFVRGPALMRIYV